MGHAVTARGVEDSPLHSKISGRDSDGSPTAAKSGAARATITAEATRPSITAVTTGAAAAGTSTAARAAASITALNGRSHAAIGAEGWD